jgi:peptide/nickel transport system ATP-binding protein
MIMITHDLSVVSEMADDVIIMYAGKIVEKAKSRDLFTNPLHPYTEGLLNCIPKIDDEDKEELEVIIGSVPRPEDMPVGCRFTDRCPYAQQICKDHQPPMVEHGPQMVSCWKYTDEWDPEKEGDYVKSDASREVAAARNA